MRRTSSANLTQLKAGWVEWAPHMPLYRCTWTYWHTKPNLPRCRALLWIRSTLVYTAEHIGLKETS